jgi:SAM-dependent methyltransferase
MRDEWDQRARDNAYHFIASAQDSWSEEDFKRSGYDSVQHHVTDDLARITRDRDPKTMTILEIGCGAGRMTRPLAELFGQVHAVDVSGEMIAQAQERLADLDNVRLHHTNGVDLSALGETQLDFALSFIVFQHIPDIDVIRGYISQVAERLRPSALFKFQVQGSPVVETLACDTWHGVRFSAVDALRAARENQLRIEAYEGVGEQYFWLSMRKQLDRKAEPDIVESALLEANGEVLNAALANAGGELLSLRAWSEEKVAELSRSVAQVQERDAELTKARTDLLDLERHSAQDAENWQAEAARLRSDLRTLRDWSENKTEELRAHIRELYASWAYRIGRRLGLAPPQIRENDTD